MRAWETLLLLADLLAYLVLAIRQVRGTPWIRHPQAVVLVALPAWVIAAAQWLAEGPRWQMLPAYALTVMIPLVPLLQHFAPTGWPLGRKRPHSTVAAVTIALGAFGLVFAAALPMMVPVFRLAPPSGPFAIGTLTYHWVDASRAEAFTADARERRQLMVQIWYPAQADPSAQKAAYIANANTVTAAFARLLEMPAFVFSHFKYVTTNAMSSVAAATQQDRYPVLLFLQGATGFRQMNTFQVEHLVSHGYIVVAIDQPGAAAAVVFPDGRYAVGLTVPQFHTMVRPSYMYVGTAATQTGVLLPNGNRLRDNSIIPYLAQDVTFTLDQLAALSRTDPDGILAGGLDLQRVGVFGVSLGGIVAGEACRLDARLRACLVMDAPMSIDVECKLEAAQHVDHARRRHHAARTATCWWLAGR